MISNKDFEKVIDCLPDGFTWGCALTPDIALHIINCSESRIKELDEKSAALNDLAILKDEAIDCHLAKIKQLEQQLDESRKFKSALTQLRIVTANDGFAATFQTMVQYRKSILNFIDTAIQKD